MTRTGRCDRHVRAPETASCRSEYGRELILDLHECDARQFTRGAIEQFFEEFYLSLLVRSIFAGLEHGFVDFRSPARFAHDYCVVDFDGTIYPTDEARMLSRTRYVDLAIGSLENGIDPELIRS